MEDCHEIIASQSLQINPSEELLNFFREEYAVAVNRILGTEGRVYSFSEGEIFISVDEGAYIPTTVAPALLRALPPQQGVVLDVGCGSGILAIGLSKKGAEKIVGIDPNLEAIALSSKNAKANEISQAEFLSVDQFFLEHARFSHIFDTIIANVPQTPGKFGSGEHGNEHLLSWLKKGKELLSPRGKFYILTFSYAASNETLCVAQQHYSLEKIQEFFFPLSDFVDRSKAQEMAQDNLCTLYEETDDQFSTADIPHYTRTPSLYSRATLYALQRKAC